jgi:hypothetical protein
MRSKFLLKRWWDFWFAPAPKKGGSIGHTGRTLPWAIGGGIILFFCAYFYAGMRSLNEKAQEQETRQNTEAVSIEP